MRNIFSLICSILLFSCAKHNESSADSILEIYETNAQGALMRKITPSAATANAIEIKVNPNIEFQKIIGFGGAMTESSAHLITKLEKELQDQILEAYFSENEANYSLVRTHINSSDFSLRSYAYVEDSLDIELESFTIKEDADDIIPMLKKAQNISANGFKILASPWTAPPYMKDNKSWFGGKLLSKYYSTWALYLAKYMLEYQKVGLPIWGLTIENEPMGNDSNWESMHFTPLEMSTFVKNNLDPVLRKFHLDPELYVFDQNKGEGLEEWSEVLLKDHELLPLIEGTAVHWYESTYKVYANSLQKTHELAPNKSIIHSEACIDAEIPVWGNDAWYWEKNATDWGWDWAPDEKKVDHPKYSPVIRYANDIIGCMNNWVSAWIDWNMVLDPQGGPNHAKNWCVAPIIADTIKQELYITPLYYVMSHFSRFIPPNSRRIMWELPQNELKMTAFKTPEKDIVVVLFNESENEMNYVISLENTKVNAQLSSHALQTVVIKHKDEE